MFYTKRREKALFLLAFLLFSNFIFAQRNITIPGTTSGSLTAVLGTSTNYAVNENLYLDAEFGTNGHNIVLHNLRIKTNIGFPSGNNIFNNVKISLKEVANTVTSLAVATYTNVGYTTVFDGTVTAPLNANVTEITIPFSTPFIKTAGKNLMVLMERLDGTPHSTGNWVIVNSAVTTATLCRRYNNNVAPVSGTTMFTNAFTTRSVVGFAVSYQEPNIDLEQIYTLGSLASPFAAAHVIKASVTNGSAQKVYNVKAYLDITGLNPKKDSIVIDSVSAFSSKVISFPNYSPSNFGLSNIKITLTPVAPIFSNKPTLNVDQTLTPNTFSTAYGTNGNAPVSVAGLGFNGATGDFVTKFYTTNSAAIIKQVKVTFHSAPNGSQPFKLGIWKDSGNGTPGALLWESAQLLSSAGWFTVPILTDVIIPKNVNYFIGYRQLSTVSLAIASQTEAPPRSGNSYYALTTGSNAWTDFAQANTPYRFFLDALVDPIQLIDECIDAEEIKFNPPINASPYIFYGTTLYGTSNTLPCAGAGMNDVWYKFVATQAAHKISIDADKDVAFQFFSGSCSNLSSIACVNDNTTNDENRTFSNLTIGDTYYFSVNTINSGDIAEFSITFENSFISSVSSSLPITCSRTTTQLVVTGGIAPYIWSNGEVTSSLFIYVSPTVTTTYSVTASSGSTGSVTAVVDKTPPALTLSQDVTIGCNIGSANIWAIPAPNTSLRWSNASTSSNLTVSPTVSTNYIVTATSSITGCKSVGNVNIVVNTCNPKPILNAKVFLNSVNQSTLWMENNLSSLASFPLSDPYSSAAFNTNFTHVNNPTLATINPSVLGTSGGNAIVDWCFIALQQDGFANAKKVVYTKAALLQRGGDLVDMDGVSPVAFSVPDGNYYVSIRHRNNLGFRTTNPVYLTNTSATLNFTNNSVPIFGATPLSSLTPNIYIMNSGDSNSDGSIDAFDTIFWETQNGLFDEYFLNSDYNMDGSVDAFDTILWELNNGKFEELD